MTTLLFEDRIIDYYEFHVHPQLQDEHNYVKQVIFFQYSRDKTFIQLKRNNRSGTQLYSVRFEAFNLHSNEKIEPIGVWEYPMYFDFLPSFRLSKILRFPPPPPPNASSLDDPCSSNPCGQNGFCQKMISSYRSSHFCSCPSGFHGDHCLCTPRFAGEHCQYQKKMISITFTLSSKSRLQADDVMEATVSFNDYLIQLLRLDMRHQQVYHNLPSYFELVYDDTLITSAPTLALMKIYQSSYRETGPEYYILYYQIDQKEINITVDLTSENYCPSVQTLWHLLPTNRTIGKSE